MTLADEKFAQDFSGLVRIVSSGLLTGSAQTRLTGIQAATGELLLFTDDDCLVPPNWVDKLLGLLDYAPVVTGALAARQPDSWLCRSEEYTDQVRTHSLTRDGAYKFVSFPNMGIHRKVLPQPVYANSPYNTAEDVDLSIRLTLAGTPIAMQDEISVLVSYPTDWGSELRRKRKHGYGVAFVKTQFTAGEWASAEIGAPITILTRWARHSLTAPFSPLGRARYLIINLVYCAAFLLWPWRHGRRAARATPP